MDMDMNQITGRDKLFLPQAELAWIKNMSKPNGKIFSSWLFSHLVIWIAGIYGIVYFSDNLIIQVFLSILLSSQINALTVLQHDCGHGNSFQSERLNYWTGVFLSWLILLPHTTFALLHRKHHANLGNADKDPDDWFYAGGTKQLILREAHFVSHFLLLSLKGDFSMKIKRKILLEFAFNVVSHIALFAFFLHIAALDIYFFAIILPILLLALVINPISRGYEHYPLAYMSKTDKSRLDLSKNTVTINNRFIGLMCGNINYHVEHHLYPKVPFYRLPKIHKKMCHKNYIQKGYPLENIQPSQYSDNEKPHDCQQ